MKKFFIGIDVSKESIDASVICRQNDASEISCVGYEKFLNSTSGFRRLVAWTRSVSGTRDLSAFLFCCEATGGYDRLMCDYLYAHGCDIWRESALQIKMSSGVRKGKNDTADSLMIARYALRHQDHARPYEPASPALRQLKSLFLYRRTLERSATAAKVRAGEIRRTSQSDPSLKFIYRDEMKTVRRLRESIRECERRIGEIISSDEELNRNYGHITSIKGVGLVNATAMLVYTNNFKNFETARKVASYYGVASFRNQSGTSIDRKASVRSLSSSMLKGYITQAALSAASRGGILHDYYVRMAERGKAQGIILNNIKNKIIQIAFSLVANDADYEENHEFKRSNIMKNTEGNGSAKGASSPRRATA